MKGVSFAESKCRTPKKKDGHYVHPYIVYKYIIIGDYSYLTAPLPVSVMLIVALPSFAAVMSSEVIKA